MYVKSFSKFKKESKFSWKFYLGINSYEKPSKTPKHEIIINKIKATL